MRVDECKKQHAKVINVDAADEDTTKIQITMDQGVSHSFTVSALSRVTRHLADFEHVYYVRRETRMFFFCGYILEGTEVFIHICCSLDPPYEIVCVTLQDYFDRKQSRDLLDQVFMTNTNCGHIDCELMNAEVLAFTENRVVVRVDPDLAERDDLLLYEMFR